MAYMRDERARRQLIFSRCRETRVRCRETRERCQAEGRRSRATRVAVHSEIERAVMLRDLLALRHEWTPPTVNLRYVLVPIPPAADGADR